jgi:hypothetical protein
MTLGTTVNAEKKSDTLSVQHNKLVTRTGQQISTCASVIFMVLDWDDKCESQRRLRKELNVQFWLVRIIRWDSLCPTAAQN